MKREKFLKTWFAISFVFLLCHCIFLREFFAWAVVVLCITAVFLPAISELIAKTWHLLSKILGYITTPVTMGCIFFIILTPAALVYQLFQKGVKQKDQEKNTAFTSRYHQYEDADMKDLW